MMTVEGEVAHATCYLTVLLTRNGSSALMVPGR